jgi:predicted nuclease with TOPRIM domain
VSEINKVLEEKMERVETAKKKYAAIKDRLDREMKTQDRLERGNEMALGEYNESEKMMTEVERELQQQKEVLFKESQVLFKLRAEQAGLIGEISSTLSASRNL